MALLAIVGETQSARISREWNTPRSQGGRRPDGIERFPKMIYRARRPERGGPPLVVDPQDEAWTRENCLVVGTERELAEALERDWHETPAEAVAHMLGLEDDIARAAGHRAFEDRNMSAAAKAEADKADEETFDHVPEVPQAPLSRGRRRGR